MLSRSDNPGWGVAALRCHRPPGTTRLSRSWRFSLSPTREVMARPSAPAITGNLLPEKAIRLSRNTVPPGSNCYRLRHGKGFPAWEPLNLQRTNSLRIRGCSFRKISLSTFQRTEICRLLSMPVRKFFLREPVSAQVIFKTLRSDRACKALSLGEVAAAVRLRIAGFGEGTPQQDSDGTE